VTDMSRMFHQDAHFNQDLGNWDVSGVTDMSWMFALSSFNQDIGSWDVSHVTNMSVMFGDDFYFDQDLGAWDVSGVTDMTQMFFGTAFNHYIGGWDVSKVMNMESMFCYNYHFNQDISDWCVEQIPTEPDCFALGNILLPENYPHWGDPCKTIGINENDKIIDFTIYPNPTSSTITIETPTNGLVLVLNPNGQQILQHKGTEPTVTIDVSRLKSGIYIVKVIGDKGVQVGKFIKK